MASNSFGELFRITTWGESHGKAIGVVIDGCPAGLPISEEEIALALSRRRPGSPYTSPRKESDKPHLLSGVYEGVTTGTPISIVIWNEDADSRPYRASNPFLRPGHATFTYLEKYGIFDDRGGGRASGRETATRVAAGAVAKKLLAREGIEVCAFLSEIGGIALEGKEEPLANPKVLALLDEVIQARDSVGGVVGFEAEGVKVGLGDPIFEKLEANLAKALLSIPACKGFEIGSGFEGAKMRGSNHNDAFILQEGKVSTKTNHAGGTLAGISTGGLLYGSAAFKPTSSIGLPQETLTKDFRPAVFELPLEARHDPCLALRARFVVEAMVTLVLADALLMNRSSRL